MNPLTNTAYNYYVAECGDGDGSDIAGNGWGDGGVGDTAGNGVGDGPIEDDDYYEGSGDGYGDGHGIDGDGYSCNEEPLIDLIVEHHDTLQHSVMLVALLPLIR